jgi:hypothetical protein
MLVCLLYLVKVMSREIADNSIPVADAFKRISWLVLIVLAFVGTHWKHNFDQGFSAGVLGSLAVWVVWPVFSNYDESRSKAKESHANQ